MFLSEVSEFLKHHAFLYDGSPEDREKILSNGWMNGVAAQVALRKPILTQEDEWEDAAEPYQLNAHNGIVDLETGEVSPHDRDKLFRSVSLAAFDMDVHEDAKAFWDDFISGLLPDQDERRLVQEQLGLALMNCKKEHHFLYIWGPSGCGKSTLINVLKKVFGTQQVILDRKALMNIVTKPADILLPLRGARVAVVQEFPEGRKLDVDELASITGDEYISSRKVYVGPIEFKANAKVIIVANVPPALPDSARSKMPRRMLVIEMRKLKGDADPRFMDHFDDPEILSAVLHWLWEGFKRAKERDFNFEVPESVVERTNEAINDGDEIWQFLDECVMDVEGHNIPKDELYRNYKEFCTEKDMKPLSNNGFGRKLKSIHGFTESRPEITGKRVRVWNDKRFSVPGWAYTADDFK